MSDLDEAKLEGWLRAALPGFSRIESVQKFPGGQSNPTYRLSTNEGVFVLRRKPFGRLLPSAHAVEREYRVLAALHPTGFPVPRPIALCEDPHTLGAPFYLMALAEGRIHWNSALPDLPPTERRAHHAAMIDTLAALHRLDHVALGLGDFGAPGSYCARQVKRWTQQYRAAQTETIPEVERLIEWLPRTAPEQTRAAITHGDYRIDNLVFAADTARLVAVLDWELATIGDPLADFAYVAMNWVMPADGRSGLAGIDLVSQGLPTLEETVRRYCDASGRDRLADLHWYFAFNLFRLVGILQGVKKRLHDGNASSAEAEKATRRIVPLAQIAWDEALRAGATG